MLVETNIKANPKDLVSIPKILLVVVYFADFVGKINNHKTILG